MTSDLSRHVWRSSVRSIVWKRELAANIFVGAVLSLIAVNLLSIGLFLHTILEQTAPDLDPIRIVNGGLIYYFAFDFLMRMLLQRTPGIQMRPYLILPVPRSHIARFLLFRSMLTLFNILPLLVLIPLVFTLVGPLHTPMETAGWIGGLVCWILCANFLAVMLDRTQVNKPWTVMVVLLAIVAMAFSAEYDLVSFVSMSAFVFGLPLEQPIAVLVPVIVLGILLALNASIIRQQMYLDTLDPSRPGRASATGRLKLLDRWGDVGTFLGLELKLLFRNKRTKASLAMAPFIFLFVPAFYLTLTQEFDLYPLPQSPPESEVASPVSSPDERLVTFKVITERQPEESWIYLTGDHTALGRWRPTYLPLIKNGDGSWSRSVALPVGITVRYIYTLGSWKNEAGKEDGETPDVQTVTIYDDTTLVSAGPAWKTPSRFLMVDIMLVYMGILLIGGIPLFYGQFMFAWESNYFDLLLSRPIPLEAYLEAKRIILFAGTLIGLVVSLAAYFVSAELVMFNIFLFLYCLGANTYVLLVWSTFARKRIDLNASIFGTQGKGASQFATILPTFIAPILIFLPFALIWEPIDGYIALGAMGLLGLVLTRPLMAISARMFRQQKFKMSAGFRQS